MSHESLVSRREQYERRSSIVLFAAGMLFLAGLVEVYSGTGDTATGRVLVAVAWVVFALDLVIRFLLDDDRRDFLRRHWFEVLAVAIPFFRIGMVLYVFVRLAARRGRLAVRIQVYAAYLTVLVVVFGAVLVLGAERNYPGSNIHTYGEAVWWALVTITTVGFGDFVPVSPTGRVIATLMLVNGVVLISVLTALIAARFVQDPDVDEKAVTLDALDERLARIEAALARLDAAGGTDPDEPPDPGGPGS
ncbi:MAG: potassium channel family protein [Candidatus Nanopelagicales bacterium]